MTLKKNQKAPNFKVTDINGNSIELKALQGKKVLVSFYRYAECIFCNLRMHQLQQKMPAYSEKGLAIVAFFQSPKEDILKTVTKGQEMPFPIVGEVDRGTYVKYGVKSSKWAFIRSLSKLKKTVAALKLNWIKIGAGDKFLIPADFLIDENGVIQQAFYGGDISEHIPFEDIEAFLDQ